MENTLKTRRKGYLYAFIILLVICIALTPLLVGILFKKNFLHLIDEINHDSRIHIDITEYHEGWFDSDADLSISLNADQQSQIPLSNISGPIDFKIQQHITHGPVIYNSMTHSMDFGYANINTLIHISEDIETVLLKRNVSMNDIGLIQINTLAKFDNNWYGQINMPALTYTSVPIGKITWEGLTGDFSIRLIEKKIKHIKTDFQLGLITIENIPQNLNLNMTKLVIQPINYTYKVVHEKTGLWSGNSAMYTPNVTVTKVNRSNIVIDQFSMTSAFGMGGGILYNMILSVNIKTLTIPVNTLPDFSKVHIIFSANNFSSQGLYDYASTFKNKSSNEVNDIDLNKMVSLLVRTIKPISSFYADASASSTLGDCSVHSKSVWKPNAPIPNTMNDVIANTYTEIILHASENLTLKIIQLYADTINASGVITKKGIPNKPQAVSVKTPVTQPKQPTPFFQQDPGKILQDLQRIGYINKDQNLYETTLTIRDGVWRINNSVINATKPKTPQRTPTRR